MTYSKSHNGFTIVELLVVIAIIGILATITIIAYNGIRQSAVVGSLKTDLEGASKKLKIAEVTSATGYPTDLNSLTPSAGTTYQYTVNNAVNPKLFCITATNGTTSYYIDQSGVPMVGGCPGHSVGGVPVGPTWTAGLSGDWTSVASSSDGTKLVAANGVYLYTSTNSGVTWIQRQQAPYYRWATVASSDDGTKLVASEINDEEYGGGTIWTSSNSGVTWTQRTNVLPYQITDIASSSDGTKLAATTGALYSLNTPIYTSTDSGVTWVMRSGAGSRRWQSIASSSDGTKLYATTNDNEQMYASTDSGVTWAPKSTARSWGTVITSSDGTKVVAGVTNSNIYTSTDSGSTFTQRTVATNGYWTAMAGSSDGTNLIAGIYGGLVYVSTDSGATWSSQTPPGSGNWVAAAMSSDGSKMFLGASYASAFYMRQ